MSLAVRFSEYGTADVLRVVDVPLPTAGTGQVRLAVRATGVNPIDWKTLHGYMSQVMPLDLPGGLGPDVAGAVDQVGEGVTAFSVGDEVLGASITPSYAQFALADPAAPEPVTYGKGLVEPGAGGPQALRDILALIEAGRLRVPIQRTYPLGMRPVT